MEEGKNKRFSTKNWP